MNLSALLKDSNYRLTQFDLEKIEKFEKTIIVREKSGRNEFFANCLVRRKEIKLTPEEIIRQLYLLVLTEDLNYPYSLIRVEHAISFGREKKRADIAVLDKDRPADPYIIVELKKPKLKDGKEQLKSYCHATGAPLGVWTNGDSISFYNRKDPNFFEDIPNIPKFSEKLSDILSERWTIADF